MGRIERKNIFEDTRRKCKENQILVNAIKKSNNRQELILETENYVTDLEPRFETQAEIIVSTKRSYAAASGYKNSGMKIAVHNFASATNPGGGVINGSSAQEECLCRCSTLYFSLNIEKMWDGFYSPHRVSRNPLHNDDCIFTPDVVVFKTDTDAPEIMEEEDWYQVDVITCAAPNLRLNPMSAMNQEKGNPIKVTNKELLTIHEKRIRRILDIAKKHKDDVVVLGAFGCGAFQNPPQVVAQAMRNVIGDYLYNFKVIEFAVYCPPGDDSNYQVFKTFLR